MSDITRDLWDFLSSHPAIIATCAADPLDATRAAVFTTWPATPDTVYPFIVSEGEVTSEASDTKTERGREIVRDFLIVDRDTTSAAKVEEIALIVRRLLSRVPLTIEGVRIILQEATGPIAGPADEGVRSRIVSLRLTFEEE